MTCGKKTKYTWKTARKKRKTDINRISLWKEENSRWNSGCWCHIRPGGIVHNYSGKLILLRNNSLLILVANNLTSLIRFKSSVWEFHSLTVVKTMDLAPLLLMGGIVIRSSFWSQISDIMRSKVYRFQKFLMRKL